MPEKVAAWFWLRRLRNITIAKRTGRFLERQGLLERDRVFMLPKLFKPLLFNARNLVADPREMNNDIFYLLMPLPD